MKPHLPLSLRSALLAAVSAAGFLTGTTQFTQAATVNYVDYTISHALIHNPTTAPSEGVEYEECGTIINEDTHVIVSNNAILSNNAVEYYPWGCAYGGVIYVADSSYVLEGTKTLSICNNYVKGGDVSIGGAMVNDGGSITLKGFSDVEIADNIAYGGLTPGKGAVLYTDNGTFTLTDCGKANIHENGEDNESNLGVFLGYQSTLNFTQNDELVFESSVPIYEIHLAGGELNISDNGKVEFITTEGYRSLDRIPPSYNQGNAIYLIPSEEDAACSGHIDRNESVYITGYIDSAIILKDADFTISGNNSVEFANNASCRWLHSIEMDIGGSEGWGGAIYLSGGLDFYGDVVKHKLTINDNTSVLFSENRVMGYMNPDAYAEGYRPGAAKGGAMYVFTYGAEFANNKSIVFDGNSAYTACEGYGGAIYAAPAMSAAFSRILHFNNNDSIEFTGNFAQGTTSSDVTYGTGKATGGALYLGSGIHNFIDNGSIVFEGNHINFETTSHTRGTPIVGGGAIGISYENYNNPVVLNFDGNDSLVFRNNYEEYDGVYKMRSICAYKPQSAFASNSMYVIFNTQKGQSVSVYDSLYIDGILYVNAKFDESSLDFNSNNNAGSVEISGKYIEEDLAKLHNVSVNQLRASYADEIEKSRTSSVYTVGIAGGDFIISDNAHFIGLTIEAMAETNATMHLRNASLSGNTADFAEGTGLTLQGSNTISTELTLASGSVLTFNVSEENKSRAVASFVDTDSFSSSLSIENGAKLVISTIGSLTGGNYILCTIDGYELSDYSDWVDESDNITGAKASELAWYYDDDYTFSLIWSTSPVAEAHRPATSLSWSGGNGTWKDGLSANWEGNVDDLRYHNGDTVQISAAGTIAKEGLIIPHDVTVSNGSDEVILTGDGQIGGSTALTKSGLGKLILDTANTYTGGTYIKNGIVTVGHSQALGLGEVSLQGGTLNLGGYAVNNNITVTNDATLTDAAHYTGTLNLKEGQLYVDGSLNTSILVNGGSISGNLTLDGGSLSLNGLQLSVGGSLIINDTFDIILDSDLQPDGTYTLITTGSGITGDLSQLVAVSDALNSRVNAQFGIDGNNLTLTLVTQSAILNWAGGKKDVWQVGAGGWAEGIAFQNGDAVNFKDGTVSIVGDVQPGDILITPTKSLTFKTSYNKKTGLYSGRIVGDETSLTIDAAGPKGKVTMNDGNTYGGGTTILTGSVTTKGRGSFGTGDITMKGGTLDLKSKDVANMIFLEGDAVIKGGKKFAGSLAVDGNLLKGSLLNIAAGQSATIFSGTINGTISGAGDTIITFNPEYHPEATAPVLDTKGKITTATLQLMENSQLIVSSKGLSMNSKVSAIEIDDGTLTSAGKISAYSLYMQGGELDVTNAKPMGITLKGAFEAESGANIDLYGGLTANQLTLDNADFTLAMDAADVTPKIKPKAQSISIKGKGVFNTITDSEVDIAGKMSVTGNLQLTDSDVTLHDVAGATKPKAQGLTVKGVLEVNDTSDLRMTGTLSAAALSATDSTIAIAAEDGLAAQNLKLTRKQVVKGVAQENLLTNSSVYVNGGMSVAGNLELNNSAIYLRDYSGKNKAKGLTVKGDLTLDSTSSIVLSGALSAKNLTLGSGSALTLTASKPGTVKVGGALTLEGAVSLDLGFSVSEKDFNKKKAFKIFSFKTMGGNLTLDSDLNELFGISSDLASLSFDSKGKAITLVVVDFEGWNEYVADVQAEAQQITPESEPVADVAEEETAEELLTAPQPVAAAAVDPLLRKAADTLVQSTWGTVNASRAFGDTIAARGAHATLLAEGKGAAWLSTMGGSSRISTDGERNGADFTLSGAAFGVEGRVTEKSTLGVAIGNSWGKVSTFSAFPVDQDSMHIGIYGNHTLTESLTLSWMATHTRTESELNLLGLPYEWAQDALQLDARLTWATAISDKTTLSVFGGLQYLATDSGESNGLKTGSVQNLRGELGIGASHKCSDSTLVFGELSFVGDMVRNNPTADLGGMRLRGSNPGRAGINLSVGAVHCLSDDWSLNASYSFELMQNVIGHSLNVGASYSF